MRKLTRLKSWIFVAAILVAAGGALALAAARSTASPTAPLWSDTAPLHAPAPSSPWVAVAKADTSGVVNISTTQVQNNPLSNVPQGGPFGDFFHQYFGNMPRTFKTHSLGSGFVIRQDGYIVTNDHVVDGATEIMVKLSDGRTFPAKVIGRDKQTDLALIKIDATGLPVLPFGNSDGLQVGQRVMAIGNPFGLQGTVTTGIVSAKGRAIGEGPYDSFIQTDASINPGNSGGPLVNTEGQVVGINTAIFSQSGGSVGIGFAIPINLAKNILPQLEAKGHVTRGWLGVSIQTLTPDLAKSMQLPNDHGALIAQVMPNSPAAKAGLKSGDVITEYDSHAIASASDLPPLVANTPVGQMAALNVLRDGKPLTLNAKIAELAQPNQVVETSSPSREKLGLAVEPLTPALAQQLGVPQQSGLVVAQVKDGSPAADAGIQPGDVIVKVDRKPVHNAAELRSILAEQKPGTPTLFQLQRKDASLFAAVTVNG